MITSIETELLTKINEITQKYKDIFKEQHLKTVDYYNNVLLITRIELRSIENNMNIPERGSIVMSAAALLIAGVVFNLDIFSDVVFVEDPKGTYTKKPYHLFIQLLGIGLYSYIFIVLLFITRSFKVQKKRSKLHVDLLLLEEYLNMYIDIKNLKSKPLG
ncbi:hypothetical protein [Lysinibacillus sphaericus]|nr:hypothetical protein [Lysinibacillus sphaericus]